MNEKKSHPRGPYKKEKRNIPILIRLTESEKKQFDERVKSSKLRQTDFVRQAILNAKIKAAPVKKGIDIGLERELLFELSRIGSNLNQLARYYNYGEPRTENVDYQLRCALTELAELQMIIAKKAGEKSGNPETHEV